MIKTMTTTTENKIYVNGKLQSWILDHLENSNLRDDLKAAFLHKHDQLEKEVQRLIKPPAPRTRKQGKPKTETIKLPDGNTLTIAGRTDSAKERTGRNRP